MLNNQYSNKPSAEELWYLSKEAVENPQKAIYEFFDTYGLGGSHDRLWHMLKLTLSSPEINNWDEAKRANCIHFYELLTQLIKANYILFLKMRKEA